MKTKINNALEEVLKSFDDVYFEDDEVLKAKVIRDIDGYNKDLLGALLSNDVIVENFTLKIDGNVVLHTNKLIELLEMDKHWEDSYTKYSKQIGLTVDNKYINDSEDVVLSFPYKDTVLKASMSKEDTDKDELRPDEPFLNEVIAKEEIDVLFDKKILVNAKKYDEDGEHEVSDFSEDDNLIIKGNNLLALHTLKEKYAGKVKLIYIDVPFNTTNDSFQYNDKFNHSTWLTFIKNRISIALDLLEENGTLFLHADDNEIHYVKVLLDEMFGREKFVNMVSVKLAEASGVKMSHVDKRFLKTKDSILIYNKGVSSFNPIKKPKAEWDSEYNRIFTNFSKGDREIINDISKKDNISPEEEQIVDNILLNVQTASLNSEYEKSDKSLTFEDWRKENAWRIFRTAASSSVKRLADDKRKIKTQLYFSVLSIRDKNLYIVKSDYLKTSSSPRVQILFADDYLTEYITDFWTDISTTGLEAEGGVHLKNGKKPEKLIQRVISFSTNKNDLVLDFFMGSATTQAVAHKMNRRYIGIEQMDYINTISVPRLQNVIEGEQGGISKDVDWRGGGSFVYVELMEKNRGFIKSIEQANNRSDIQALFEFMLSEADIDFNIHLENLKDTFYDLTLIEQKQRLIQIIDKNQLYYNYYELEDKRVSELLSENDIKFNHNFYNEGGINNG